MVWPKGETSNWVEVSTNQILRIVRAGNDLKVEAI